MNVKFGGLYKVTWDADVNYKELKEQESGYLNNFQEVRVNSEKRKAVWATDDGIGNHATQLKELHDKLEQKHNDEYDEKSNFAFIHQLRLLGLGMLRINSFGMFKSKIKKHFVKSLGRIVEL